MSPRLIIVSNRSPCPSQETNRWRGARSRGKDGAEKPACGCVLNPRWLQVGLMSVNRAASETMHTPPSQIEYFPSLTRCLRRD